MLAAMTAAPLQGFLVSVRYMLSPVRPSVCLSVCNAQVVQIFRNISTALGNLGHPLTSTENFTEMSQGKPSAGGVKHKEV